MPNYLYKCKCGVVKEVSHPMSEVGNLSDETKKELTCGEAACTPDNFTKLITAPSLVGFHNGTSMSTAALGNARKAKNFRRSKQYFKDNILPNLKGTEKKSHEQRLKKEGI